MVGRITLLFWLCFIPRASFPQKALNGFYILMENQSKCDHPFPVLHEKTTMCSTEKPIISDKDFVSVSEIMYDSTLFLKVIELKLSTEGFNVLRTLATRLPDSKIALVLDGKVTGIYKGSSGLISQSIPISGSINSNEVDWIYERLKKMKL